MKTILSTKVTYSCLVSEVKTGALTTHRKQGTTDVLRAWNSARIAKYLVFHNGISTIISLKKTSTLYWKLLATRAELLFSKRHILPYLHLTYLADSTYL